MATWGETARDRLRELGLADLQGAKADRRRILESLGSRRRLAFAASVTERLLRNHEELPEEQQRLFSLTWRPVIDAVWLDLAGGEDAFSVVSHALGHFYLSPYNHNDGPDGPDDADEDEAAAAIYTAECLMHGCGDTAAYAGDRGVDSAFRQAAPPLSSDEAGGVDEFVAQVAHPLVQQELSRQSEDLWFLMREGGVLDHGGRGAVLDPADGDACPAIVRYLRRS